MGPLPSPGVLDHSIILKKSAIFALSLKQMSSICLYMPEVSSVTLLKAELIFLSSEADKILQFHMISVSFFYVFIVNN